MPHIKWPEITSFHNVRKAVMKYPELCNSKFSITYRAKCKLHGTNSCVQIVAKDQSPSPEMEVLAQSRSTILLATKGAIQGHDNAGFGAWVKSNEEAWKTINWANVRAVADTHCPGKIVQSVCFFGEWVGNGIQRGTALNKLDNKVFALFAMMIVVEDEELPLFVGNPSGIKSHCPEIPDTYVLPYHGEKIVVDYSKSAEDLQETADLLGKAVDEVEACDPWVKSTFGIEGIGEGLVYFPVSEEHLGRESFSNLAFKAKGEKHKVVKQKQTVQVNPETAASIDEFIELVVTEPRLEQGATEVGGEFETKKIGKFIGWVTSDVHKECQSELEASSLTWKQVTKAVTTKARLWYMHKIDTT